MTVNEALTLQGFKSFVINTSKIQILKQIGNSMSVNVVKCILTSLLPSLDGSTPSLPTYIRIYNIKWVLHIT